MTLSPLHYVAIGPHGTFQESGMLNSSPTQIDALFEYLAEAHVSHLALYFHGGVVSEESGRSTAESLTDIFLQIGVHPIFFIWKTGLQETTATIVANATRIMNDPLVQKLLLYILQQVTKRWGVQFPGKGAGQMLSLEALQAELARQRPFAEWDDPDARIAAGGARGGVGPLDEANLRLQTPEIEAELDETINIEVPTLEPALIEAADNDLLDPELRQAGMDTAAKGIDPKIAVTLLKIALQTTLQVLSRRSKGLDHGLYPTVFEELLRAVSANSAIRLLWDVMKEKAAEMWLPDPRGVEAGQISKLHVGTYFLKTLIQYVERHPGTTVDLIGHSAGSIVICNLLKTAAQDYSFQGFGRIALLAPAASMSLFHAELTSHPERYEALRIYMMKDELECKDAIAGPVYPRSLLYFVSGVLEATPATPLSGLARCYSGIAPYQTSELLATREYVYADGQARVVLSRAEGMAAGLNSTAARHGDFDDDPATRVSLQEFLRR